MKYLYNGGLQIRSNEAKDEFYKIDTFIHGELSLHKLYDKIKMTDIPIAQDCFGDQFLIRDNLVIKLEAESGEIEELETTWDSYLKWVDEDPIERLNIPDDLELEMGYLLLASPPFCTSEGNNAQIAAINGKEVILFHADFARKISGLEDGQSIKIEIVE